MSSLWVCAQELGHAAPFVSTPASALLKRLAGAEKLASVTPATQLTVRPEPEMVSSGIVELDALTGGLPRGCLSEICGPASSGRTSVLLAALAAATQRQEVCALVDTSDAFDPVSAAAAGVDFGRLLWVRCGGKPSSPQRHRDTEKTTNKEKSIDERMDPLAQTLRVTDLLLQSGGFGMVAVDLGDVPLTAVRRIPLTSWFRFQRAVENTPTVLLAVAEIPCAPACAALLVKLQAEKQLSAFSSQLSAETLPSHALLFDGFHVDGEILRSRAEKKPVRSATTRFATRAVG
jgi:recombination protein RecA